MVLRGVQFLMSEVPLYRCRAICSTMGNVLQSTKPAGGGLIGGGLCGFDASCCLLSHHAGRPPVPSLAFCDLHPREVNLKYPDLDVIRKEAWPFYRTISGVRLCWELEEPKGPKILEPLCLGWPVRLPPPG